MLASQTSHLFAVTINFQYMSISLPVPLFYLAGVGHGERCCHQMEHCTATDLLQPQPRQGDTHALVHGSPTCSAVTSCNIHARSTLHEAHPNAVQKTDAAVCTRDAPDLRTVPFRGGDGAQLPHHSRANWTRSRRRGNSGDYDVHLGMCDARCRKVRMSVRARRRRVVARRCHTHDLFDLNHAECKRFRLSRLPVLVVVFLAIQGHGLPQPIRHVVVSSGQRGPCAPRLSVKLRTMSVQSLACCRLCSSFLEGPLKPPQFVAQ